MPKKRRQDCKQCLTVIHGNYGKHQKECEGKHDAWLGWKYFSMDGITEITEDKLPIRKNRGKKTDYDADGKKERDPKVTGWNKLKQGKWTCKRSER